MRNEDRERLQDAFARAAAAHIVIDVQKHYCAPENVNSVYRNHPVIREGLLAVPPLIADFVAGLRGRVAQGWVTQPGMEPVGYYGGDEKVGKRARTRAALFGQDFRRGDVLSHKGGFNAFENASLHRQLQRRGVDTLILSGVFADQCVMATAKGGRHMGYDVFVVEDLTARFRMTPDDFRHALTREGIVPVAARDVRALAAA